MVSFQNHSIKSYDDQKKLYDLAFGAVKVIKSRDDQKKLYDLAFGPVKGIKSRDDQKKLYDLAFGPVKGINSREDQKKLYDLAFPPEKETLISKDVEKPKKRRKMKPIDLNSLISTKTTQSNRLYSLAFGA